jgi:hypothetical protein
MVTGYAIRTPWTTEVLGSIPPSGARFALVCQWSVIGLLGVRKCELLIPRCDLAPVGDGIVTRGSGHTTV